MSTLQKIIAILSITCYLAMASIAVASAIPMAMGTSESQQSTDYFDGSYEAQGKKTELGMPCHQGSAVTTDDANSSNHCQMLCAAIGHVVVSTEAADKSPAFHRSYPHIQAHSLFSTQLNVEQQPPK